MKHGAFNLIERIIPLVFLFSVAGCAEDYLASGLPMLKDQPISKAVHYLGPAAEEKKTGDKTIYTWVNEESGSFLMPSESSYPEVVQSNGHPMVVYSGAGTPQMTNTYNWHCRLDITTKNGIIVDTQYQGNTAGCEVFSKKLKRLSRQR